MVEEAGEAVGDRRALGALVDRDLDDLGVVQLAVHVDEIVEQGHAEADVAAKGRSQAVAVGLDPPPVPVGFTLAEAEMGEDREEARVDGLARLPVSLELREEAFFVGRVGFEELEQVLADVRVVGRSMGQSGAFLAGNGERL